MHDDRIDFQSDSYVMSQSGKAILIDPLPMKDEDLTKLGSVDAICLTASCHERAAGRYRQRFKVLVYAPHGAVDFEEPPDRWYRHGEHLPGNLMAVHAPGPTDAHYALYLYRDGGVVFCADLLRHAGTDTLGFVSDEYQDEPRRTRDSVQRLLDLRFETLCPNHGDPITTNPKEAMRQALAHDVNRQS